MAVSMFLTRENSSGGKARRNHSCHAKPPKNTPLFGRDDLLSGSDFGDVPRFRAQSVPGWEGETCRFLADSRTILGEGSDGIPDSRSGLKMGDLIHRRVPVNRSCVAGMLEPYPPLFDEKISCLVTIPGESGDSGHNPGLDGMAKSREIFNDSRTSSQAV